METKSNERILIPQITSLSWAIPRGTGFTPRQGGYPGMVVQQEVIASSNVPGKSSEPGLKNDIYRVPTDIVWQEAWKVTEGVLVQMRDEIVQKGARFFVIVLTNPVQVHPNVSLRNEFARTLGVKDLFYPDRRLEKFCQRKGIPVLLLAPYFQKYATNHQIFLHGFGDNLGNGHWNQEGHRLAGQIIAQWLCPRLN